MPDRPDCRARGRRFAGLPARDHRLIGLNCTVGYRLGVDLGTSFTAAAIARDGRVEMVSLGTKAFEIPTVAHLDANGEILVGEIAARRALADPTRMAREFKRRLGDPTPILLGGAPVSPERLMAAVLRWVLLDLAEREGGPPDYLVVTHPANWGRYKQDLFEQVLSLADAPPASMITEPEAAAVSFASTTRVASGEIIALYDLGGGTFDAAVLRKTEHGFERIGSPEGVEHLGGTDFDDAVFEHVRRSLGPAFTGLDVNEPGVRSGLARLRRECIEAKEQLSTESQAAIAVALPGVHTEVLLTRAEFETAIRPALTTSVDALQRALRSARLEADDVKTAVLAGGSSRIPLVAELIRSRVGLSVSLGAHPKHAVAVGAAILAADREPGSAQPATDSVPHVVLTTPPAATDMLSPREPVEPTEHVEPMPEAPAVVEEPAAHELPVDTDVVPTEPPPDEPSPAPHAVAAHAKSDIVQPDTDHLAPYSEPPKPRRRWGRRVAVLAAVAMLAVAVVALAASRGGKEPSASLTNEATTTPTDDTNEATTTPTDDRPATPTSRPSTSPSDGPASPTSGPSTSLADQAATSSASGAAVPPVTCDGLAVGYFGPLTGGFAGIGLSSDRGVALAIDEFNGANPDCQVEVIDFDSQASPDRAPAVAAEAIDDTSVIGLVGPAFSAESAAVGGDFADAGLATITPSATNPTLAQNGWPTWNRIIGNDSLQAPGIATYVRDAIGSTQVFLVDDGTPYGKGLADTLRAELADSVVGSYEVETGQQDFSSVVTSVTDSLADTVVYGGDYVEAGLLLMQLREAGYQGEFVAGEGALDPGFLETAGEANAEGTVFICTCAPPTISQDFTDSFRSANGGNDPELYGAEAYDATNIFLAGIAAGISERGPMVDFVRTFAGTGVTKAISFDETGEIVDAPVFAFNVRAGTIVGEGPIEW